MNHVSDPLRGRGHPSRRARSAGGCRTQIHACVYVCICVPRACVAMLLQFHGAWTDTYFPEEAFFFTKHFFQVQVLPKRFQVLHASADPDVAGKLPLRARRATVSFHNFKSQNFKSSVSIPKNKYVAYVSVLSQISNCQGLGRKINFEILKTDRTGLLGLCVSLPLAFLRTILLLIFVVFLFFYILLYLYNFLYLCYFVYIIFHPNCSAPSAALLARARPEVSWCLPHFHTHFYARSDSCCKVVDCIFLQLWKYRFPVSFSARRCYAAPPQAAPPAHPLRQVSKAPCIYVWLCIYVYMYMYIYIYIYTYVEREREREREREICIIYIYIYTYV